MAYVTELVAGNLYFYVSGFFDKFFDIDAVVAKGGACFLSGAVPVVFKIFLFPYYAHTFTTAASGCFEYNWVANFFGDGFAFGDVDN